MDHEKRGYALIFSHENFDSNLELDPRPGSHKTAEKLKEALTKLKLEAEIFSDFTYEEIKTKVNDLCSREEDLRKSDCILIIVMTHGLFNDHLYSKDTHYPSNNLPPFFTTKQCPSLAGKPKLFIFQACRGDLQDTGTKVVMQSTKRQTDGPKSSYKLPAHADFLTACSTAPRHTAFREPFIEAFCEELSSQEVKEGKIDFLSMLTNVQRKVALETNEDGKKQIPSVTSTLTRKIFF
ncbi:hypothetical protein DAPPUDRAFT_309167 [Daphnia pulex]|uniref:Caspase family p20 domain-containing protein n=1 Tax=Daphnia pulex TaxID=6669 RepID=E9HAI7_DAPPU|nr:hypothetical protein DAPPUDRAFT_309167 [Daphnia pulex]|eukprot:EFX71257.1 hypothetical protein DAPPUDRAFT_309167 [Daphnia pulex]